MTDRITGKVASVTSDREVLINRGSAAGVERGMRFAIKGPPIEVVDPDSDEVLGEVSPTKVVVRVDEVDDRFCIARTFRTTREVVDEGSAGDALGRSLRAATFADQLQPPRPRKYETRVETLRLDPRKGSPINESDSVVSVGDIVESLGEEEEFDQVTTTLFR